MDMLLRLSAIEWRVGVEYKEVVGNGLEIRTPEPLIDGVLPAAYVT